MVERSAEERQKLDSDVNLGKIVKTALVLLLIVGLSIVGVFVFHAWRGNGAASNFGPNVRGTALKDFAAPRLQGQPMADRKQYFAAKRARLNGYGWVDRARGIVHIPIDEAISKMIERHDKERQ
jgi:hypothetical protein